MIYSDECRRIFNKQEKKVFPTILITSLKWSEIYFPEAEKARRAKLAAERRAKVMAQMKNQMNKFIANNTTLFEETNTAVTEEEEKQDLLPLYRGAALGVWGGGVNEAPRICIMCQEQSGLMGLVITRGTAKPYRIRQPTAFDVEKKEYLCPLCERLCNTALPLLPALAIPSHPPPPLSETTYADSTDLIIQLKHQICSETVHLCTEYCEDMLCTARARSVGAMSSDMEDESADEAEVYISTHAENLLPAEFLAHFDTVLPEYNETTKTLIEDFAKMLPGLSEISESGGLVSVATLCRATSYTIQSTNTILQAEKRPLLGDLPSRHRDALQTIIRLAAVIPAVWSAPKHVSHHALSALNTLGKTSPLTHEVFGTLVALVITIPSIFSKTSGPARPTHLARQLTLEAFRATLTKALIITEVTTCTAEGMEGEEQVNPDLENLLSIMKELRRGKLETDNLNPSAVWECVKKQCLNFLRCCCLFFHFLSDIQPSTELTVVDGATWDAMCGYLNMPHSFRDLIDNLLAKKKAAAWAEASQAWFQGEILPSIVLEPSEPPRLVTLPDDFSELMNVVSEFTCPNSEREDSKNPTMCLVCGQILCSQSYCCQIEVSKGLRRGNPLHLCQERYEKLRMIWLSHGIYERIARGLDTNMLVTTTWQNM
ncbi:jg6387 [Pararge aegeria aegeria]|uniref:E3 ubiquitin-protein ligase n=1 Tax=Pararge aegeria aegeria TaxID=348720 RepID=A0A8S4RQX9_9NEOP|nr:jg6387 [Pararge aegeria aegeria]